VGDPGPAGGRREAFVAEGAAGAAGAEERNVTSALAWIIVSRTRIFKGRLSMRASNDFLASFHWTDCAGSSPATLDPNARLSRISVTSHRDDLQPGRIAAIVADLEGDRRVPARLEQRTEQQI
jgi:hypothetical protein